MYQLHLFDGKMPKRKCYVEIEIANIVEELQNIIINALLQN